MEEAIRRTIAAINPNQPVFSEAAGPPRLAPENQQRIDPGVLRQIDLAE